VSTAYAILCRREASNTLASDRRGGVRISKLTPPALAALSRWVDEKPDSTLMQLKCRLAKDLSISMSTKTVSCALTKIGFTSKLLRTLPIFRNCPATVQARREYAQRFPDEAPSDHRDIIWVDECGFNLHLRRKYGRAKRGERASIAVANNRGHNVSVCAGMSQEGLLHEHLRPGAYNAEHFCTFIEELFETIWGSGRSCCWIILDNARFHHSAIVSACAARHGHTLVFLPPYSPMLNPIESLFGKWKTLVRTQAAVFTQDSLLASMSVARIEITRADCLG
jgi:hypothetical protein